MLLSYIARVRLSWLIALATVSYSDGCSRYSHGNETHSAAGGMMLIWLMPFAFSPEQTAPYRRPAMVCLPFDSRPIAAAQQTSEMCHKRS